MKKLKSQLGIWELHQVFKSCDRRKSFLEKPFGLCYHQNKYKNETVRMIAKLRHFVPSSVLINIYKSLILPYLTYELVAWGNASELSK